MRFVVVNAVGADMHDPSSIAGVILAGGRSSRMGQNKALLDYHGKPLIEHMMDILHRSGIQEVFISGSVDGYECIPDSVPFHGPAFAIRDILRTRPGYKSYLFLPVDMPRLKPEVLRELMTHKEGGYFIGWPLPVFLSPPLTITETSSVQDFIDAQGLYPIDIPTAFENCFVNTNTPQEWKEALVAP